MHFKTNKKDVCTMHTKVKKIINWWFSTKAGKLLAKFSDDNLPVYSAYSAFFLFLSIFPMIILLSTLIRYTPLTEEMVVHSIQSVVPETVGNTLVGWINEIFNGGAGYISFSVIFIIWSASKSFIGIIDGLDNIYKPGVHFSRLVNRLRASICTIFFLAAIGISSILLLFGSMISKNIQKYIPDISNSIIVLINFRLIICFALLFILLTLMYSFLTRQTVNLKNALPGALVTTISWFGFSYLYSLYIDYFFVNISIYGSITTIILLLLWMYICVYIFLTGAEINYIIIQKKTKRTQE